MSRFDRHLKRYSKKQNGGTIFVGITGHRDLDFRHQEAVVEELAAKFVSIQRSHPDGRLVLLTALANGPDQWAALAARKCGMDYIAVLPMEKEDYLRESVLSGLEGQLQKDKGRRFIMLLESAAETINLFQDKSFEKRNAYQLLGKFLVKHSDHLIGIWDGIYNGKPGGTSDVMGMAFTLCDQQGERLKRTGALAVHWLSVPRSQNPFPLLKPFTWQVYDPAWASQFKSGNQKEQQKKHKRIREDSKTALRWIRGIFLKKIWIPVTLILTFVFGSLGYQEEKRLESEFFLQMEWREVADNLENLEAISRWYQEMEGRCHMEWWDEAAVWEDLSNMTLSR